MSRYASELQGNTVLDGDRGFLGVDMRREPELLEAGLMAEGINVRCVRGVAETRKGLVPLSWVRPYATTFPLLFDIIFDIPVESTFGTVYGVNTFSDPNSLDYLLICTSLGVYFCSDHGVPVRVLFPDAVTVDDQVDLVQAFDKIVLFRGESAVPLQFDSSIITEGETEFSLIDQTGSGSTEPIPNAHTATLYQNRLFVPFDKDQVAISDILNYTRYDAVLNQFKINQGDNAELMRIYPWNANSLVCFKSRGIFLAQNVYGDFSETRLDEVSREIGLVARRAVTAVGPDIWFLDQTGVRSLQSSVDYRLQATTEPISAPIQPLIDRIAWSSASNAAAITWDNKFYLAVPIDGSTTNNAILVYDLLNKAWTGYDTGPLHDAAYLVKIRHRGQVRLCMVSSEGNVYLYEEGFCDELATAEYDIESTLALRGFDAGDTGVKRQVMGSIELSTWNPELDITAQVEGVNETETIKSAWTRSREEYVIHGREPYELDNANDDHGLPGRQDYSVHLKDGSITVSGAAIANANGKYAESGTWNGKKMYTAENGYYILYGGPWELYTDSDFAIYYNTSTSNTPNVGTWLTVPTGTNAGISVTLDFPGDFNLGNGVDFEAHQRTRIPFTLRRRGRRVQVRLVNSSGRVRLHSAETIGQRNGKDKPDTV